MTVSFLSKINHTELNKLCDDPGSVDALNLVKFSNAANYRWYGLFLSPLVLLRGGKPLFVGKRVKTLYGENISDELVIIRYPSLRTFSEILTGRYYTLLNRVREKGVHYFEFSFTKPVRESSVLWKKGLRLVVHFNYKNGTFGNILDKITNIIGKNSVIQLYASRKMGVIPLKGVLEPSDPNPFKYEGTAIFSILEDEPEGFTLKEEVITDLKAATTNLSVDIYRSLGMCESMPWSK